MTEEPILLDEFTNTSIVTGEIRLQKRADKMDGQEDEDEDEDERPGQARCGIVSRVCVYPIQVAHASVRNGRMEKKKSVGMAGKPPAGCFDS
ncbi:uncharacterized protein TrAFT101_007223 [Trichoderma asperellum]|uniref:uncharacterized protein n=1 Tax=Trichoderma asperellum TaxID=101201 RepID=UPI0033237184|nr:hypothetical protein TrAFT101_007223 [Trichoderma asperellum]